MGRRDSGRDAQNARCNVAQQAGTGRVYVYVSSGTRVAKVHGSTKTVRMEHFSDFPAEHLRQTRFLSTPST